MKKGIITGMALLFTIAAGTTAFAAGAAGMGGDKTVVSAGMRAYQHGENICADFGRNCGAAEIVKCFNEMREYCPVTGCDGSSAYCTQPLDADGNRICSYHGNEYCAPSNDCPVTGCDGSSAYCTQPLDADGNRICSYHGNEYCEPSIDCPVAPCDSNSAYCTQPVDENGNRICGVHSSNCVNGQVSGSNGTTSGGHHSRHHGGRHH